MILHPVRNRWTALTALLLVTPVAALPAQSPVTMSFGAGFVAQRQTGPSTETSFGYTAVLGVNRPISRKFRLHADARYSFDLALGPMANLCYSSCIYDGLSTTKVLSAVIGLDYLTSQRRVGLLLRAGGGMHHLDYPSPGTSALLPSVSAAVGLRVPFGPRGAFLVEGRLDQIFGAEAGPSRLMPVLFGFEL
jgi:hypothetical protein